MEDAVAIIQIPDDQAIVNCVENRSSARDVGVGKTWENEAIIGEITSRTKANRRIVFLVQGGALHPIEGAPPAPRVVIYNFDSVDKLQAWRNGPEQKELIAMRDRSSHFRSFAVEGLPN
jgi:uncharacterized protein (DUF1330 family)